MRTNAFLRALVAVAGGLLAACSAADNPYASIKEPPLVKASLHTVTVVGAEPAFAEQLRQQGFSSAPPAPNYPGSVRVLAALWKVPEAAASAPVVLVAPAGRGPNVRLLSEPVPENPPAADAGVLEDFYRNVLGTEIPRWPAGVSVPAGARAHVWTFLIDDVVSARRRLREAGIPIAFDAVAITTAYFGDHKLLGITAPDGAIVELVETAAH
jgi:hypothetical protein